MRKRMSDDRRRQVATTKLRHGEDFYKRLSSMGGKASATFKDKAKAKLAITKRWHPEYFDEDGKLKPEYMEKIK